MHSTNIYWLVLDPTDNHFNKKRSLEERGFVVVLFKTLSAMLEKVLTQRAGFYIVGDEGAEANVLKAISALSCHPDLAGAKLVLSISQNSPAILRAAACEGFRDILPLEISDKEWTQRFLFSTATRPIELPSPPSLTPQDLKGHLALPARLVTINVDWLFIESRLSPKPGDPIELNGPLCQAMGQSSVHLVVEDRKAPHLRYRFSEGFYASWNARAIFDSPSGKEVQQVIRSFGGSSRPRIFLAIQSPALRASLMRHLDQKYYDIHSALQKRSILEDPKFFAPHLVFIEERMCINENLSRFAAMAPLLPVDSTIVVLGDEVHKSALEGVSSGLRIVFLRQVPINLRDVVEKSYLPASARQPPSAGAYSIPSDHEFSMGGLIVPCRMTASHPSMVRLAIQRQVGTYTLAQVSEPWLHKTFAKDPYVKIMQIHPGDSTLTASGELLADCYFCDIMPEQRKKLARITERPESSETMTTVRLPETESTPLHSAMETLPPEEPSAESSAPERPVTIAPPAPSVVDSAPAPSTPTLALERSTAGSSISQSPKVFLERVTPIETFDREEPALAPGAAIRPADYAQTSSYQVKTTVNRRSVEPSLKDKAILDDGPQKGAKRAEGKPQRDAEPNRREPLQRQVTFSLRHWIMLTIVMTIAMTVLWLSVFNEN